MLEHRLVAWHDGKEDARDDRAESTEVALAGQPVHRQRGKGKSEEEVDGADGEGVIREQPDHFAAEEQMKVVRVGEPACILVEWRTEIGVRAVPTVVEYVFGLRQPGRTVAGQVDGIARTPLPDLQGLCHRENREKDSQRRAGSAIDPVPDPPRNPELLGELVQTIP